MIPFALPDIGPEEIAAVTACLEKGWVTSGMEMAAFEKEMSVWLGGETPVECVALNSATAGLLLALLSLDLQPGDEVLVPALTFVATINTVVQAGGMPVLVDVDSYTYCMSVEDARKKVTKKTKAMVPVHYAGNPCDMVLLGVLAAEWGIKIIEDAAHALGASIVDTKIGAGRSYATVFSFYATKCITTGEGGMLVTRSPKLVKFAKQMRLHGIDRDAFDRYTATSAKWEYDVVATGHKCNMTDLAASMGRVQLKREAEMRWARTDIALIYHQALDGVVGLPDLHSEHAQHLFPVLVEGGSERRAKVIDGMYARGVGASVHFKPLYRLSRYLHLGSPEAFPVTEAFWQGCISLPLYSKMTVDDVGEVVNALREALRASA